MNSSSYHDSGMPAAPHFHSPPQDVDMPDATLDPNVQYQPHPAPNPGLQSFPAPASSRPFLPPIDTDLPLRSFENTTTFQSPSALFGSLPITTSSRASANVQSTVPSPSLPSPGSGWLGFSPSPTQSSSLLPIPSTQELLDEFAQNKIQSRQSATQTWELQCGRCFTWVNMNLATTRPLLSAGQFTPLHNHIKGRNCSANKARSISGTPALSRRASVASFASHPSPSSTTSSPNLSRGPSVPPSPNLSRGPSVPPSPLIFSPRVGQSPLPTNDVPLPFTSLSYDHRFAQSTFQSSSSSSSQGLPVPASASPPSVPDPTVPKTCPGVVVQWPLDLDIKLNEKFPFHRIPIGRWNGDLPFYIELHERGDKIIAWSKTCTGCPTLFATHCHECDRIIPRLDSLAGIAEHAERGTNYKYLNHSQLQELLVERNKENNELKLQSLNMSRQLATFARKMGDYERLMIAIAENDVPRINALLSTAIRNGASVNTIIAQITEAVRGLRSTKGFTQLEHDLSLLIYRIGGQSLLYSLNHALGLPSLRTIGNSAHFVKISPCFGPVTIDVIRTNIRKVILEPRAQVGATQKKAVTIMMDEVALEEHLDYFPLQNKVGGLCQKHSGQVPYNTLNLQLSIDNCRQAAGRVPYISGKRWLWSLFGVGGAGGGNVWGDQELLPRMVTHCDAKSVTKCFAEKNCRRITPLRHSLESTRLNLCTGIKLIIQTFDWRHIIKRESTLVRQPSGMCVDAGRVVNPHFLAQCLQLLAQHDEKSVDKLLNPDDPQDVPRAIDLIEAIISVRDAEVPSDNVDLASTSDSVRLLGHVFENFALPFITPEFSLSRQIRMLSTCAHLTFVLFREYRTDFMSNQLYGDTQSTIKSIVFSVAKQQLEDGEVNVNANEDGTDPLEGHFAFMRTAGGHNSAMNYKQGIERNGWASDGHTCRRRRITRTEHKDHLNSSKWDADLKAGNCDLIDCWAQDELEAVRILSANSRLTPDKYDFRAILATPGVDFLRPWGENNYPGFADDLDRSVIETAPVSAASEPSLPLNTTGDISDSSESEDEGFTPADGTMDPEPITLQDLLDDGTPQPLNLTPGPGIRPENYVADENDKPIHKASICRLILNKEFVAKSKERVDRAAGLGLGRVRCFTKVESRSLKAGASGNMTGNAFIPGDIFLALVRHKKTVSMAVVRSTAILHDGRPVRDIPIGTIGNVEAKIKLTGQIVHLESVEATSADLVGDDGSSPVKDSTSWLWTGAFLTCASKMKGSSVSTIKPVLITVPGTMVELINPAVVEAHGRLSEDSMKNINSAGTTWALHHPYLTVLLSQLSQRLADLRSLPSVTESAKFPYKSAGKANLVSERGTLLLADKSSLACLYCLEVPKNWRAHIGAHILRRIRQSGEPEPKKKGRGGEEAAAVIVRTQVGNTMPCGYCGRSGRPECHISMKLDSKKNEINCKCTYRANFQFKTADEGRTPGSCRNVPILCGLCPPPARKTDWVPAVWRYNMPEHLRTQHSEYASPQQPEGIPLPYNIWESMKISREEELGMGIKGDLIPPQFTQVAAAVDTLKRTTDQGGGKSKKMRK
ncbi:hypothetical protein R3P38DRAFT_3569764 [Favolaschia claudopus]|uniref:Uncharacterized protein n=1 Tax=Favolaschia claudopus TaxID=2862362 RepID=A0AAW0ASL1_9AGAR